MSEDIIKRLQAIPPKELADSIREDIKESWYRPHTQRVDKK